MDNNQITYFFPQDINKIPPLEIFSPHIPIVGQIVYVSARFPHEDEKYRLYNRFQVREVTFHITDNTGTVTGIHRQAVEVELDYANEPQVGKE